MQNIMKKVILVIIVAMAALCTTANTKNINIKIIGSSDVHGCFMPYDYITNKPRKGTLSRAHTYIKGARKELGDNVILIENGDILQGQPANYFYNYIETEDVNIAAQVTNYMGYDIQVLGNHDIEPGPKVYNKWIHDTKAEVLGANILNTSTGLPAFTPYKIFVKNGVKIAVIGMTTPAIPNWLDKEIWCGLQFEDMTKTARIWVNKLQKEEKPDVIIGLFHSGRKNGITTPEYEEDATERIAREVPGFNAIFYGHDHTIYCDSLINNYGEKVVMLNPGNNAHYLAELNINVEKQGRKIKNIMVNGKLINIDKTEIDRDFVDFFAQQSEKIKAFSERQIGRITKSMYMRDAFFGSSMFNDFIHNIQLKVSGADVSFNAPLSFNTVINEGILTVADMFNLYHFENNLYVILMTGDEIRRYLEMSYGLWVNTMSNANDHIMLLDTTTRNDQQRMGFKNLTFNFDSASGIIYEVDVTKPVGKRINIISMANGEPFSLEKTYKAAINSYRANNGGELLTKGAGIKKDEINDRIIWKSRNDIRHYIMNDIEERKIVTPTVSNNWRFVPEEWVKPAIERDRKIIFGK